LIGKFFPQQVNAVNNNISKKWRNGDSKRFSILGSSQRLRFNSNLLPNGHYHDFRFVSFPLLGKIFCHTSLPAASLDDYGVMALCMGGLAAVMLF